MLLKVYTLLPFNVYSFNLQIKEITVIYTVILIKWRKMLILNNYNVSMSHPQYEIAKVK